MIIATYESKHPELPDSRRWIAQIEKIKGRFYVTFHGATEEEAYQKAADFVAGMVVKQKPAVEEEVQAPAKRRRDVEDLA